LHLSVRSGGPLLTSDPWGGESLDVLAARLLEVDESGRPDAEKKIDIRP